MSGRVYLDWNATAPLRPEARDAMVAAMDAVGNPSSVHAEGRKAKAIVETARRQVAVLVGCAPGEVVFTSGATEAANCFGPGSFAKFAYSEADHDCLFAQVLNQKRNVVFGFADNGVVVARPDLLDGFNKEDFAAVAFWTRASGETGIVQSDFPDFGAGRTFVILEDAVQALGKVSYSARASSADFIILSAHKLGGPKGVGALIVKGHNELADPQRGGGQEMGRRSGTENVAGIAGFGAACEAAKRDLEAGVWERVSQLRNILEKTLATAAKETIFVGKEAPRLPNTSCFSTPGWKGETQVMQMDLAGFAISAGSACSSGKVRESRVLRAMGFSTDVASSAIRVSLGPTTTEAEVMAFAEAWISQYEKFRQRAA